MGIKRFEDIIVWQKAQDLSVNIYEAFKNNRDYSFKDQITRASVSISNNIAEGFDRSTNPDFKRFLYFAIASNSEVRSMLYLAIRLKFLTQKEASRLIENSNEIAKMISGLIKSLNNAKKLGTKT
ncbi:four helix bundle protein [Pseudotenacibaculum sp. MALMAid0570]|uniref:four helix bundle protein n=1 Tax=Pseudotenacibaculum sp. MALMAid0570 TaxID=3143938 RepID=UPI0032DE39A7